MLDTSKPHTVVVVTSTCRLPFAKGKLGPGVYHFQGDQRKYIRTVYHKKQAKASSIYFIAGDTEQALATIAAIKSDVDPVAYAAAAKALGATPVEFEGDLSAMGEDTPGPTEGQLDTYGEKVDLASGPDISGRIAADVLKDIENDQDQNGADSTSVHSVTDLDIDLPAVDDAEPIVIDDDENK